MKKRISKRVREEAAMLCQLAASNDWARVPEAMPHEHPDGFIRGLALSAEKVARKRLYAARQQLGIEWTIDEPWAEAEALLRTGWTP